MCWDEGRECFPPLKKIKSRIYGSLKSNFLLRCKFLICHIKIQELSAKSFFASETCERRYEKRVAIRFLFMSPRKPMYAKVHWNSPDFFSKPSCRFDWLLKNEPLSGFICVVVLILFCLYCITFLSSPLIFYECSPGHSSPFSAWRVSIEINGHSSCGWRDEYTLISALLQEKIIHWKEA